MEQLADIKKRMKSVRSVQKITKAMELISSVKSRQSKRLYARAVPFFSHCATTLLDMLVEEPEFHTDLIEFREKHPGDSWNVLAFVLTSDKDWLVRTTRTWWRPPGASSTGEQRTAREKLKASI